MPYQDKVTVIVTFWEDEPVTEQDTLNWHDFIKETYGCLADAPIERGPLWLNNTTQNLFYNALLHCKINSNRVASVPDRRFGGQAWVEAWIE